MRTERSSARSRIVSSFFMVVDKEEPLRALTKNPTHSVLFAAAASASAGIWSLWLITVRVTAKDVHAFCFVLHVIRRGRRGSDQC